MPVLRFDPQGAPLCNACHRCVEICPSRALRLEVGSAEGSARPRRFELALGACIGCGACVEVCPEDALGLASMPRAVVVGASGRPRPIDLLGRSGSAP